MNIVTNKEFEKRIKDDKGLIYTICNRYRNTKIEYDELINDAYYGYYKAMQTFDENKGYTFSTYVSKCMINAILQHKRTSKNTDNIKNISISLNYYVNDLYDNNKDRQLQDLLRAVDDIETITNSKFILEIFTREFNKLSDKHKQIISNLYKGYTQYKITEEFNIPQARVSRIKTRFLSRLKAALQQEGYYIQ